jgi:Kef-type K+ transport system membrane component KefB
MPSTLSPELQYVLLVFGLFIVPRILQRFKLPGAVTALILGAITSIGFHVFHADPTIELLGTLGIVAMFLFAGLEIDFLELRRGRRVLFQHVTFQLIAVAAGAFACMKLAGLDMRSALLGALALLTPSTGFILDSLGTFGMTAEEGYWVRSKAIASELVALALLLIVVQSVDGSRFLFTIVALTVMVVLLPVAFRWFARFILPFAPRTEFAFLVIMALLCAFVTRELGVYYLVGAFVVGLTAVRLRQEVPELSSGQLTSGVEFFASFFIPFYFFKTGLHLQAEDFSLEAIGIGLALVIVVLPLQILRVAIHRKLALGESWSEGARIGVAVMPTLVFTIVIAEILRERFALPSHLFGALIVFTVVNTLIPGLILKLPPAEFEAPKWLPMADQVDREPDPLG